MSKGNSGELRGTWGSQVGVMGGLGGVLTPPGGAWGILGGPGEALGGSWGLPGASQGSLREAQEATSTIDKISGAKVRVRELP